MSENAPRPPPKDRTALYIAIVGALATVSAAFIGILPGLLNRAPAPAPTALVATANPMPTQAAQPTTVSPTLAARIDFLVTNNRAGPFDFFIDDEYQITVPPGGYQVLRVIPGEHRLTHCPRGTKPSDSNNECETLAREVKNEPYDWQLGGTIPARGEVLLFLLNQIDHDVDIYIEGQAMVPVNSHKFGTIQLDPGTYMIRTCPRGATPAQGICGTTGEYELLYNVEMYVVNVP